jgi:hypothetical protein
MLWNFVLCLYWGIKVFECFSTLHIIEGFCIEEPKRSHTAKNPNNSNPNPPQVNPHFPSENSIKSSQKEILGIFNQVEDKLNKRQN